MNIENRNIDSNLYEDIKNIIEQSKHYAVTQVNYSLVIAYWNIGKMIKENIIENKRAEYGEETIKKLAEKLTLDYGSGFGQRNLFRMMKFYEFFPDKTILTTLSAKFSWSHFVEFIRLEDDLKRDFYISMCYNEKWSVRALRERINTMLFERTAILKNLPQDLPVLTSGYEGGFENFYEPCIIKVKHEPGNPYYDGEFQVAENGDEETFEAVVVRRVVRDE